MKKLILVLVAPVLVIAGIEGVLSLFNVAPQPPPFLPAERDGRRVYCSNQKSSFWSEPFIETCVAPEKPPGTYRVFVIGESTPNGFPFTRHCSPASWLQVRLAQLHPGKSIEVVRLASNGRHARELVDFCDEILPWHPDLLVFYCGHNEFLIFRIPEIKHPMQAALRAAVMKWRLGRSIASLIASKKDPPPDELPDTRLIADTPYLTAEEFAAGQEQYRRAVEEIHKKCEAYGTRLLVCLPACNLRDYPPTYSSFAAQTSEADRVKARALVDQATMLLARGEKASARPLLEAALEIDSTPAIAHFDLGRTLLEVDNAHALREFESARDLDMYPNRAQQPLLDILREQASRGVLVADCPAVFNGAAEYGVPGDDLFVDHCHPELSAQSLIATAILQAMAEADLVAPRSAWDFASEPDTAEYCRRLNLSFPDVASEFAANAIAALLNRLGSTTRRSSAAETAERVCGFALRYDPQNGTARLGQSLAAFILGRKAEAKKLAAEAVTRDSRMRYYQRTLPAKYPELKELFAGIP